ncbi:MAG: methyltransferase domain-containing protein [Candidatus Sumerlaeota bacterium]|nr:methyltransferase domain-containing protein [Candidatus Sumerlaeota bacterium]
MSQYRNLAAYWSALFPVSPAHQRFLAPFAERCAAKGAARSAARSAAEGAAWLDIGCGAGNLLLWLSKRGVKAWGLEPDEEFIHEARRRLTGTNQKILRGGMLDLERLPSLAENARNTETPESGAARIQTSSLPRQWAVISCLGNVLAHAADLTEAREFFHLAAASLEPEGALLLQVVNYDKVFASESWSFPVLRCTAEDGTALTFERRYRMDEYREGGRLIFETILRAGDSVFENKTSLLPLRKSELETIARENFSEVLFQGDFEGASWTADSPATVLICRTEKP